MKPLFVIAKNTYLEIIRDRILYGLIVFALFMMGLSLALGQLSFAEQKRISANFGLSAIHLGAVVLAIFVGSSLVSKEIEKKTILTILVRPIMRWQFILGKYFGLAAIIATSLFGLACVLGMVFWGLNFSIDSAYIAVILGIFLESLVLLAATLFFSTFASPFLVLIFSFSLFLLGHWIESLKFFSENSNSALFEGISKALIYLMPNLESFNWRSALVYKDMLQTDQLVYAGLQFMGWSGLFILGTMIVFERKDFV